MNFFIFINEVKRISSIVFVVSLISVSAFADNQPLAVSLPIIVSVEEQQFEQDYQVAFNSGLAKKYQLVSNLRFLSDLTDFIQNPFCIDIECPDNLNSVFTGKTAFIVQVDKLHSGYLLKYRKISTEGAPSFLTEIYSCENCSRYTLIEKLFALGAGYLTPNGSVLDIEPISWVGVEPQWQNAMKVALQQGLQTNFIISNADCAQGNCTDQGKLVAITEIQSVSGGFITSLSITDPSNDLMITATSDSCLPCTEVELIERLKLIGAAGSQQKTLEGAPIISNQTTELNLMSDRYVKMDFSGNPLPEEAENWDCVWDKETNLLWEVKTLQGPRKFTYVFKWKQLDTYVSRINNLKEGAYCGSRSWRAPSEKELITLVDDEFTPAIDLDFFPLTVNDDYWTSERHPYLIFSAKSVDFEDGWSWSWNKGYENYLRLVTPMEEGAITLSDSVRR